MNQNSDSEKLSGSENFSGDSDDESSKLARCKFKLKEVRDELKFNVKDQKKQQVLIRSLTLDS